MSERFRPTPEIIREFSDRSTLWLLEDPANLRDLLRMLAPGVVAQLDFDHARRVNRSFIQPDLRKKESDLIFRVPLASGEDEHRNAWVYVLLEHQSVPDREMALRLLLYLTQLWDLQRREWEDRNVPVSERYLSPVVPVVLYTGAAEWPQPLRLLDLAAGPAELHRFIPAWETLFLNVRGTSPEALSGLNTAIGWALRVVLSEQAPLEQLQIELELAIRALDGLSEEQAGQWSRVAWFLLLLIVHRRSPTEYTELQKTFWDAVLQSRFRAEDEVTRMSMTMAELLREEGREEGEVRGFRSALRALLEARFGAVPAALQAAIERADAEHLLLWTRQAAVADSLGQIGIGTD
jgi:hypothetical protein